MNTHLTDAILQFGPGWNVANHPAAYVGLARGYLEAGDVLADRLRSSLPMSYQPLMAPMMFLYRHAIELGLKALIRVERQMGERGDHGFDQLDRNSYDFRYSTARDGSHSMSTARFDLEPIWEAVSAAREEISGKIVLELTVRLDDKERQEMQSIVAVLG